MKKVWCARCGGYVYPIIHTLTNKILSICPTCRDVIKTERSK